jgi:23S rRNA (cytidine1920-2'-O)/16S rRNA (cytidine1409-2'-O)-methyltransferase
MKDHLARELVRRGLVATRSQAESYIRLGKVRVAGHVITKTTALVDTEDELVLIAEERYVSRAGLKLASIAEKLSLKFEDKIVLDVGSSTGGFTDYALQHGARRVFAVDVGTNQLHNSLRGNPRIELHEKTDVRDFIPSKTPDIVVIDVSFVSLRQILPHIARLASKSTEIIAMVKPQFEANSQQMNRGIIKNNALRRKILSDFEAWAKGYFFVDGKADSEVAGTKGNRERFYKLRILAK